MTIDKSTYNNVSEEELREHNLRVTTVREFHLAFHQVAHPYLIPTEEWMLRNAIRDCERVRVPWVTTGNPCRRTLWQQKELILVNETDRK